MVSSILGKSPIEILESEWFVGVLNDVEFFNIDNPYPQTQFGYISFLKSHKIKLEHTKEPDGWLYYGCDESIMDCFTEDFNYYKDFDECVNISIIECMCYLAECIKQRNKNK